MKKDDDHLIVCLNQIIYKSTRLRESYSTVYKGKVTCYMTQGTYRRYLALSLCIADRKKKTIVTVLHIF